MTFRGALKKFGSGMWWFICLLAAGAMAVLLRRSPRNPKKTPEVPAPKMDKADDNAKELVEQQEALKEQHAQIEDVLAPKAPEPQKPLRDAVKQWNEG